MEFFRSLGRRAQRVKEQFSADDDYGCLSCTEVLDGDYDTCPHCGSDEVVVVE